MSELKVNKVTPRSGTTVTLGDSGDTITIPSGATITNSGTVTGFGEIILGTPVASTSGTSIDFTGLPSTAKRITVMLDGVSTNGTSNYLLRIGDVSGISSSGYSGFTKKIAGTTLTTSSLTTNGYLLVTSILATSTFNGVITITNVTGNLWIIEGSVMSSTDDLYISVSKNTLSATLTQLRITTINGTDTFDAGSINISYE
jgi:hypothetical protein